jgi:hypothetical protein
VILLIIVLLILLLIQPVPRIGKHIYFMPFLFVGTGTLKLYLIYFAFTNCLVLQDFAEHKVGLERPGKPNVSESVDICSLVLSPLDVS